MILCARRFREEDVAFVKELIKNRALGCIQGNTRIPGLVEELWADADYPIIVVNDAEQGFPTTDLPKIPLNSLCL